MNPIAPELIAAGAFRARAEGRLDAETVPSPCINVCRMTPDRSHCEGCFRTLDELRAWRDMDDAGKRAVWALIAQRSGGARVLDE